MKKKLYLIIILILFIGGVFIWWNNGLQPVADPRGRVGVIYFTIMKGESVKEIANKLKAKGLIKDATIFYLFVKQQGLQSKMQAGEFALASTMSVNEIVESLQRASNDIRITILEGKRAEEIADILKDNFSTYQSSWEDKLVANEGYLFPDTYSFAKDADIETIIKTMHDNFNKKYTSLPQNEYPSYTQEEIVTIASLVEREAKFQEDRSLVASVIFNRLEIDMVLNLDATTQYSIGKPGHWWPQLVDSPKNILPNSAYNTYSHAGLPPTPIANPGFDVLSAVVSAPKTDYFYYVSDSTGHNHYSKTLEGQEENIQRFIK